MKTYEVNKSFEVLWFQYGLNLISLVETEVRLEGFSCRKLGKRR